jgi:DNA mismatch repair protein MutL
MAQVLGSSLASSLIQVDQKSGPFTIKGFIGAPDNHRHNRSGQYLYINKRAVVSQAISFAVKDGFGTRIGHDRHPVYVLHLEMPCELVDVNVHPQKKEVRLTDESWIKQVFLESIQNSFQKQVAASPQPTPAALAGFSFSEEDFDPPYQQTKEKTPAQYQIRAPIEQKKKKAFPSLRKLQVIGLWNNFLITELQGLKDRGLIDTSCGEETAMAWVDLKAAKARCLFDKITKGDSDACHMQGLFFPLPIDLAVHEVSVLEQMVPILSQSGFNITQSGPKSFLIDAIPAFSRRMRLKTSYLISSSRLYLLTMTSQRV